MDESTVDLKELLRILKKRRLFIINVFLIAVIIAVLVSFLTPPTFEAETVVRVKQSKGLADSLLSDLPMGNTMATKQLMSTYAEILKSRTVLEMVLAKTPSSGKKPLTYETFSKRITTEPVKDTELLKIAVEAPSAEESKRLANLLVDSFIQRLTFLARVTQTEVRQFIGSRLDEAKKELDKTEAALERYKRTEKIVDVEAEVKAVVDRMSAINQLSAQNIVNQASSQARLRSAEKQLAGQKQGFVADNPLIQQYKSKLGDSEVQLVSLLQQYTEKHPQVIALRAAIEETKLKLNQEISKVVNAESVSANPLYQKLMVDRLQSQAEIAAYDSQAKALAGIIAQNEAELSELPAKEQSLGRLMLDANLTQQIYLMLANRFEEARISEVMQPTDIQIIDVAVAPEKPIKPKKTLNVLIAAFLGLFAGTGLAFMIEYLNKTIRDTEDVRLYLDLPVLGSIPKFQEEQASINEFWGQLLGSFKKKQPHRRRRRS
ncbi:polysaccharide chain length determinant protein (PEP-CTERM system associated) [Hydrogenispora ethanolica]|uniref:Polysaccharide chain length determinant protein (PEP-CTERM system associated) n=1 Tax=Hydrogenispora ethanolica TaxID=1082276 RepID=A0A4R1RW27_HYDET|nr:Wzz/FepE/Etk N-terminal domain-containing protein [Hydrogenispora ethanolica]TCL70776.1 polysaccharide chain length determinant protein (PEP-CTERM system associated) [Hydrogenispora ethanolica]